MASFDFIGYDHGFAACDPTCSIDQRFWDPAGASASVPAHALGDLIVWMDIIDSAFGFPPNYMVADGSEPATIDTIAVVVQVAVFRPNLYVPGAPSFRFPDLSDYDGDGKPHRNTYPGLADPGVLYDLLVQFYFYASVDPGNVDFGGGGTVTGADDSRGYFDVNCTNDGAGCVPGQAGTAYQGGAMSWAIDHAPEITALSTSPQTGREINWTSAVTPPAEQSYGWGVRLGNAS